MKVVLFVQGLWIFLPIECGSDHVALCSCFKVLEDFACRSFDFLYVSQSYRYRRANYSFPPYFSSYLRESLTCLNCIIRCHHTLVAGLYFRHLTKIFFS